jgi:hypothetical protein
VWARWAKCSCSALDDFARELLVGMALGLVLFSLASAAITDSALIGINTLSGC